jgi:hypothetical protein
LGRRDGWSIGVPALTRGGWFRQSSVKQAGIDACVVGQQGCTPLSLRSAASPRVPVFRAVELSGACGHATSYMQPPTAGPRRMPREHERSGPIGFGSGQIVSPGNVDLQRRIRDVRSATNPDKVERLLALCAFACLPARTSSPCIEKSVCTFCALQERLLGVTQ